MSLKERLRRLERPSPTSGFPATELSRRLDRLLDSGVIVPATKLEARSTARAIVRLPGRRLSLPAGETFLCETTFSREDSHGRFPLSALDGIPHAGASRLFPEHLEGMERPEAIAFLDTETTGLAGGAGTVAFLIGIARWQGTGFRIAQLFLEDLDREDALLEGMAHELRGVECLVTYNGASYDLPLLRNRHVLNRRRWPLASVRHLDVLFPARALWRQGHSDCRLSTLERGVLGYVRHGDVPGAEIPAIYSRYLRRGPNQELLTVLSHNRLDLLSLAGLLWAAGEAADDPAGTSGLGVGTIHARRGRHVEARKALEGSLQNELPNPARLRALRNLALACKRLGEWKRALELWNELRRLAPGGDPFPVIEAAKVLERRMADPARALAIIEEALQTGIWSPQDHALLEERRRKLLAKLQISASHHLEEGVL